MSLEHVYFADEWKKALVHPLLKTSGLQLINKNFRSLSNLYSSRPNLQRRRLPTITGAHASQKIKNLFI